MTDLAERLERLLPQTQCGQCGYAGCRPYAEAMALGEAPVDRCPPGGDTGARALARVLDIPPIPYDRARGLQAPPRVALVIEEDCIGCTKCIQACPVDAIIGATRRMHTVLEAQCTGCDLCVAPCPVDCISMREMPSPTSWSDEDAQRSRARHAARAARLERDREHDAQRLARKALDKLESLADTPEDAAALRKRAIVEAAIARARARRAASAPR
jgi:electron transport complex protein RnfB